MVRRPHGCLSVYSMPFPAPRPVAHDIRRCRHEAKVTFHPIEFHIQALYDQLMQNSVPTSLIARPAPKFAMPAVSVNEAEPRTVASSNYAGEWLLLLFYPRDFSFVCPTELTSFSARAGEFERRNCR